MNSPSGSGQGTPSYTYSRGWRQFSRIILHPLLRLLMRHRWAGRENIPEIALATSGSRLNTTVWVPASQSTWANVVPQDPAPITAAFIAGPFTPRRRSASLPAPPRLVGRLVCQQGSRPAPPRDPRPFRR